MSGKAAAYVFCGVCGVLAILLFTGLLSSFMCALTFAVALVLLGALSKGFKRQ